MTINAFKFKTVLSAELDTLNRLRSGSFEVAPAEDDTESAKRTHEDAAFSRAHKAGLTGLAFSGGGIRSATFNLGVLQALAKVPEKDKDRKKGLLSRFDYLSTVSGGGYIGSWLSAFLHRHDEDTAVSEDVLNSLQHKLSTRPCGFGPEKNTKECEQASGFKSSPTTSGYPPLEHAAVRHLRRYSNYLAPRLGLSGDKLTLVSLFLRNFVLLQLALVTLLATALFVPYLFAALSASILRSSAATFLGLPIPEIVLAVGLLFLLAVLFFSSRQLARVQKGAIGRAESRKAPKANARWVALCTFASWMIVMSGVAITGVAALSSYLAIGAATYFAFWWIGFYLNRWANRDKSGPEKTPGMKMMPRAVLVPLFSGAVFGLMGYICGHALDNAWVENKDNLLAVITFGPPAILLVVSFIVTIHIGTARDLFSEMHREWWARLGGYVLLAGALWLVLFAVAFYAPPLIMWLGGGGFAVLIAWIGSSGAGAWIASRAKPGGDEEKPSAAKALLVHVAPWLFISGLAFLVATCIYALMIRFAGTPAAWPDIVSIELALWNSGNEIRSVSVLDTLYGFVISLFLFLAITWGLDINIFSAHTMYKNRLVRAYLGASRVGNRSTTDPFTKFDENDDLWLAKLDEQRPIPILNATLNMTGGDDLAWQTRRAASFSFTPKFVGFEAKSSSGVDLGAYRRTEDYAAGIGRVTDHRERGLQLGTAMAISGAAASPNMGYHTSAGIAALLTAFNLRLGYWAGNPSPAPFGHKEEHWNAWQKKAPLISAQPIIAELTGSANGESDWVNLSDGGHFENLGIYELVRRRCRFIVVTDAGCDPDHEFQDLANAVRKCWTDLGVHMYFPNLQDVALQKDSKQFSSKHGCVGLIEYPDRKRGNAERYGIILYLKSSLTEEDFENFVDIRQYATEHKTFPHQSTADQFFDENQFEAYRHLGYCVIDHFRTLIDSVFVDETSNLNHKELDVLVGKLRDSQDKFEASVETVV